MFPALGEIVGYNIEVLSLGEDCYAKIVEVSQSLNAAQNEFRFDLPPERLKPLSPQSQPNNSIENLVSLPGEFWGIATYFNPTGFLKMLDNAEFFSERIRRQGLKLVVVELAFGDDAYEVPDKMADHVIRLRSTTVLWQKERLLNIALQELPERCDKVAWLDADVLFGNCAWVEQTSKLLQHYVVVQPYEVGCWLSSGVRIPLSSSEVRHDQVEFRTAGIAFDQITNPIALPVDYQMLLRGHTGFAWAARRSVLARHGFYDRHILGSGDRIMSWAMYGFHEFPEVQKIYRTFYSQAQVVDALDWSRRFFADVRGSVFFTEGPLFHLWHGSMRNRRYRERQSILRDANFDPQIDISLDSNCCWRWSSNKPELHQRICEYFDQRSEGPRKASRA